MWFINKVCSEKHTDPVQGQKDFKNLISESCIRIHIHLMFSIHKLSLQLVAIIEKQMLAPGH